MPSHSRSAKENAAMIHFAQHRLRPLARWTLVLLCATFLAGAAQLARADDPKPDPAGTATGDRTTAADAAGTPFVVSAPTDKTAPDYAGKLKAYQEFQA